MARINEKTLIKIAVAIGVVYLMYLVFVPRTCSMCSGHSSRGHSSRGHSSRWSGRGNGVYGLTDGTNGEIYGRLDYEDDTTTADDTAADDTAADDTAADDTAADDTAEDRFVEIPNEDEEDDFEYSGEDSEDDFENDDFEGDSDLEDDFEDDNDLEDDFEDETFALYENDLGRDSTVYM